MLMYYCKFTFYKINMNMIKVDNFSKLLRTNFNLLKL